MLYLRHRSVTGGAGSWWRYDAVRGVVFLMLQRGTVAVDVCSTTRPRFGAFAIVRVDETTWKIVPARYACRGDDGSLLTVSCAIDESIGVEPVGLLNAPEDVRAEMAIMEWGSE